MSNGTKVVKRNGNTEPLDLNKLHVMVDEACKDLAGVSASQVEMQSGIQFYDGITTAEIQEILIRSASDLIDLEHPNYQFVAARLLLFALRKQINGRRQDTLTVYEHTQLCVEKGVYDGEILISTPKKSLTNLNHSLTITVITCLPMQVFVRWLISIWFKTAAVAHNMRRHSLCTC